MPAVGRLSIKRARYDLEAVFSHPDEMVTEAADRRRKARGFGTLARQSGDWRASLFFASGFRLLC